VGNPLFERLAPLRREIIMNEKEKGRSVEKRIRITDSIMNEQINRIMTLPGYRKSCNRAINEALFYGLPILIEKLFGESIPQEEIEELKRGNVGSKEEEMNALIVRLLRETVLNVTINKSILSSLFNAKMLERKGLPVQSDFDSGLLADTPDYLNDYEIEGIKKLRR
jgi:hypothetical protein